MFKVTVCVQLLPPVAQQGTATQNPDLSLRLFSVCCLLSILLTNKKNKAPIFSLLRTPSRFIPLHTCGIITCRVVMLATLAVLASASAVSCGSLLNFTKNYRTDLYETFDTYSGFLFQFLYATICNNLHVSITIIIYLHILLLLAMCAQTVMGREQLDLPVSVQAVLFNAAGWICCDSLSFLVSLASCFTLQDTFVNFSGINEAL